MEKGTGDHRQDKACAVHAPGASGGQSLGPGVSDEGGAAHRRILPSVFGMAPGHLPGTRVRIMLGGETCRLQATGGRRQTGGQSGLGHDSFVTERTSSTRARLAVHPMLSIRTARLELIAAPADVTSREASGVEDWYAPLQVERPEAWPPPFNDEGSQTWFAGRIARERTESGWLLWYVVRRPDTEADRRVLIGNGGFTGAPDARGSVEIGYSLLPAWQRQGYGTELTAALVSWAFSHERVQRVLAVTYPMLDASIRVLEKNGFQRSCRGADGRSLVFELRRGVFECRRLASSGP
jgi:[ribosomal protein S5]-alanine N-acetyltransferase